MERYERGPAIYHMECDICGKKEDIIDEDPYRVKWWWTKHWSKVIFEHTVERRSYLFGDKTLTDRRNKQLALCPECTKKFKKLMKNVKWEE